MQEQKQAGEKAALFTARKERKSLIPYPLGTHSLLLTLPLGLTQTPMQSVETTPLRFTLFKPSFIWKRWKEEKDKEIRLKKYTCLIVGSKPRTDTRPHVLPPLQSLFY